MPPNENPSSNSADLSSCHKAASGAHQTSSHATADFWYYPVEMANDLKTVGLPNNVIQETLACAWEYTRYTTLDQLDSLPCILPYHRNWSHCGVQGELVDPAGDYILGYNIDELLDTVFAATPAHIEMKREYRNFLLITTEKTSYRRNSELFRRYVDALASSPKNWFRLRDCDGLVRFTIAAALACNDFDTVCFSEEELQIFGELGDTMYDAVAFHKHRAEGENNSTFAYVGQELRQESFRCCREVLWALDVAWTRSPAHQCVLRFLRPFGGPIHLMMRRYRFIEDGLTLGMAETEEVVAQTRLHFKLWNRVDATETPIESSRFLPIMAESERLMFPGFDIMLQSSSDSRCLAAYTGPAMVPGSSVGLGVSNCVTVAEKIGRRMSNHSPYAPQSVSKSYSNGIPARMRTWKVSEAKCRSNSDEAGHDDA